jgi:hypothetical protein
MPVTRHVRTARVEARAELATADARHVEQISNRTHRPTAWRSAVAGLRRSLIGGHKRWRDTGVDSMRVRITDRTLAICTPPSTLPTTPSRATAAAAAPLGNATTIPALASGIRPVRITVPSLPADEPSEGAVPTSQLFTQNRIRYQSTFGETVRGRRRPDETSSLLP